MTTPYEPPVAYVTPLDPTGAPRAITGHVSVTDVAGAPGAPRELPAVSALDVTDLTDVVVGHREHMWWGTMLLSLIEGSTLAICLFAYFYVRRNFIAWPPARIYAPNLVVGTGSLLVMLLSLVPARWVYRTGEDLNFKGVRTAQLVFAIFSLAALLMRGFEFGHLHVRWDETAYGSVVWATMVFHSTLLLTDTVETCMVSVLTFKGPWETKRFADAQIGGFYWTFTVLAWIPLYVALYLYPRWG